MRRPPRNAEFWKEEHDELEARIHKNRSAVLLAPEDLEELRLMHRYYLDVSSILAMMAKIVRPDSFKQLTEYGFEGL